jgi:hypothetical protein
MSKKSNLFSDQSSSSRVDKLKRAAISESALVHNSGILNKNNIDQNSRTNALSRVRGGGYSVPPKVTNRVVCDAPRQKHDCEYCEADYPRDSYIYDIE